MLILLNCHLQLPEYHCSDLQTHYPDYQKYTFNAVGSVAYYFKPLLQPVVEEFGMKMGVILKAPMEGLIKYHLEH